MTESIIHRPQKSFGEAFEHALESIKARTGVLVSRGAIGAALVLAPLSAGAGCATPEIDELDSELLNSSVQDWAQLRGERNPAMVTFEGSSWVELADCSRFCSTANIFLKLHVQPVQGVDLSQKSVGVMYRTTTAAEPRHGSATYVRTLPDGTEEWQALVPLRGWDPRIISFNVWYETGEWYWDSFHAEWRKRTYFDDNGGDLHVVSPGPSSWAVRREYYRTQIEVDPEAGVSGAVTALVANFDYEKEIELVWTTDDWATSHVFRMGDGSESNQWYFVEALPNYQGGPHDFERWQIDLDVVGPADHFEYAILYRHGLGDGARAYEFWDNNYFRNYRQEAETPEVY